MAHAATATSQRGSAPARRSRTSSIARQRADPDHGRDGHDDEERRALRDRPAVDAGFVGGRLGHWWCSPPRGGSARPGDGATPGPTPSCPADYRAGGCRPGPRARVREPRPRPAWVESDGGAGYRSDVDARSQPAMPGFGTAATSFERTIGWLFHVPRIAGACAVTWRSTPAHAPARARGSVSASARDIAALIAGTSSWGPFVLNAAGSPGR